MNTIINDLQILFRRELNSLEKEIELFPDDELVWKKLPGISNSVGNIALHICGNLMHFVGKNLDGIDYTRNRDAEFAAVSGSRIDLLEGLKETRRIVNYVLSTLSEDTLTGNYPIPVAGVELPTQRFLIHLSIHLGFHLGQAGYLRRVLLGSNDSTSPLSITEMM